MNILSWGIRHGSPEVKIKILKDVFHGLNFPPAELKALLEVFDWLEANRRWYNIYYVDQGLPAKNLIKDIELNGDVKLSAEFIYFEKFNNDNIYKFTTIVGSPGSNYYNLPDFAKYQRAYFGTYAGFDNINYHYIPLRHIVGEEAYRDLLRRRKLYTGKTNFNDK